MIGPEHPPAPMPRTQSAPLVPFLIRHCLAGALAGWTAVGIMLWLDVAGVGRLVLASDLWPLPLLMLLGGFGITFGSAAMGAGVMALGMQRG